MGTFLKIKENYHIANGYMLQYAHINTREESIKITFSHSKFKNTVDNPQYLFFPSIFIILTISLIFCHIVNRYIFWFFIIIGISQMDTLAKNIIIMGIFERTLIYYKRV